jgi:hypothetical protein
MTEDTTWDGTIVAQLVIEQFVMPVGKQGKQMQVTRARKGGIAEFSFGSWQTKTAVGREGQRRERGSEQARTSIGRDMSFQYRYLNPEFRIGPKRG